MGKPITLGAGSVGKPRFRLATMIDLDLGQLFTVAVAALVVIVVLAGLGLGLDVLRTARRIRARLLSLPSDETLRQRLTGAARRLRWSGETAPGLVLSGGGGKGAYEIGCLEALRDAGLVDFSAIAGTSVGSLNAALVAEGGLDAARTIWTTISRGKVLAFTHPLRRGLWRLPLLPFYVFRHLRAGRDRVPPSLWEAASVYWNTRRHPQADRRRLVRDLWPLVEKGVAAGMLLLGASLFVGVGVRLARLGDTGNDAFGRLSEVVLGGWGLLWVALALTIAATLLWIGFVLQDRRLARSASLASNDPLRGLLEEALDAERLLGGPPTYVTVASLRVLDPPDPPQPTGTGRALEPEPPPSKPTSSSPPTNRSRRWLRENLATERDFPLPTPQPPTHDRTRIAPSKPEGRWASGRVAYVPTYVRLQDLSPTDIHQRILDSASLPEVFPRRAFDGGDLVDGGVADNIPLLPLLRAGLRDAVVIYLDRRQGLRDSPARIRQLDRERIAARPFGAEPSPRPAPLPPVQAHLLRIVPSVPLGSIVSGTLNFTAHRANQLIRLGYADTVEALEAGVAEWEI